MDYGHHPQAHESGFIRNRVGRSKPQEPTVTRTLFRTNLVVYFVSFFKKQFVLL